MAEIEPGTALEICHTIATRSGAALILTFTLLVSPCGTCQRLTVSEVARDEVICFALCTVHDGVLKLTAQLYPLGPKAKRTVRLEIEEGGKWKEIAQTEVIEGLTRTKGQDMQTSKTWGPLPREEVIKAVERRNPSRVPLIMTKWWGEGLVDQYGDRLKEFDRIATDAAMLWLNPVDFREMGLSWQIKSGAGHDSTAVVDEWSKLDEFIEKLPDPETCAQFDALAEKAERCRKRDMYVIFGWWQMFFERPWSIRGMQNLLTDYYADSENIHRLNNALCDLYCGYLDRAARDIEPDGFFTSDDLGHQTNSFISAEIFDAMIKPYYMRIGRTVREKNFHWWLHSCGDNTPLMPALIDSGLDVFHPVQKGTMDEEAVAREFGDRLSFLAGIDVQHVLQEKDPEGIREEVRFLIDTFDRPDGGLCLAAGNGIVSGTPIENIRAFLEEAVEYGSAHRQQYQ
jgi:uroporphyrinogen decarboxylase